MRVVRFAPLMALVALSIVQIPAFASVRVEDSINVDAEKRSRLGRAQTVSEGRERFPKRKKINEKANSVTLKEHFCSLPFVGNTTLDYTETTKVQEKSH